MALKTVVEIIKNYLEHHFEPEIDDHVQTEGVIGLKKPA